MSETEPPVENNSEGNGEKYSPDALDNAGAAPTDPQQAADVNLDLILDVAVDLSLRVGTTSISIRQLVNMAEGSVVALDRSASEPLDVLANGTLIAHGEIVVVNGKFGVRLTDVVSPAERIRTLN
ncbi:MAG: flagellar motor switch protein FliN [Pseudomonadota bacterium]